jgi:hypothetical protein
MERLADGILGLAGGGMSASAAKTFTAVLEPLRTGLGWVIARVPFDVQKAWPERKRLRVRGDIEGFAFRTSLFSKAGGRRTLSAGEQEDAGGGEGKGRREGADQAGT